MMSKMVVLVNPEDSPSFFFVQRCWRYCRKTVTVSTGTRIMANRIFIFEEFIIQLQYEMT